MKTNIAETTDKEIHGIMEELKKRGHTQEDEMCLKMETPFEMYPDGTEDYRKKRAFFVLYPELLSYYSKDGWVTIPWICCKVDVTNHQSIGEKEHREMVRWFVGELEFAGYKPFHDEDAFAGYATRIKNRHETILKTYINPDFPEGYWSNHTL